MGFGTMPVINQETKDRYLAAGLGKVPDQEVADTLGISKQRVSEVRRTLGIRSYFDTVSEERLKTKVGLITFAEENDIPISQLRASKSKISELYRFRKKQGLGDGKIFSNKISDDETVLRTLEECDLNFMEAAKRLGYSSSVTLSMRITRDLNMRERVAELRKKMGKYRAPRESYDR